MVITHGTDGRPTRSRALSGWLALALAGGLALALGLGAAVLPAVAQPFRGATEPSAEWNQAGADSRGSYHVAVAPLENGPVELWRHGFDEVLSEPVIGNGVAYAVVTDSKTRYLQAIRLADGELLERQKLKRGGRSHLAVWEDTIAVGDEKAIETYAIEEDGSFKKLKSIKGPWNGAPSLCKGLLFASDGKRKVHAIDPVKGKKLASARAGYGRPAVVPGPGDDQVMLATIGFGSQVGYRGTYVLLHVATLNGVGSRKPEFEERDEVYSGRFGVEPRSEEMAELELIRYGDATRGGWFVQLPFAVEGNGGVMRNSMLVADGQPGGTLYPFSHPVSFDGETFYGVHEDGSIFQATTTRRSGVLKKRELLPSEFRPGPAAMAGGVVLVGNMALRVGDGAILYTLESAADGLRMIPAGDGRVLYATIGGSLVCLGDAEKLAAEVAAATPAEVSPLDAYATARDLLTKHRALVAEFLQANYAAFIAQYVRLVRSPNYVTKRQSLKLLGELLLDRSNFAVMTCARSRRADAHACARAQRVHSACTAQPAQTLTSVIPTLTPQALHRRA